MLAATAESGCETPTDAEPFSEFVPTAIPVSENVDGVLDSGPLRGLVLTTGVNVPVIPGVFRGGRASRRCRGPTGREAFTLPAEIANAAEVAWWMDFFAQHERAYIQSLRDQHD